MRRYALLGLGAALGLAVAAPTWAQSPEDPARGLPTHVHVGRLCDACAKKCRSVSRWWSIRQRRLSLHRPEWLRPQVALPVRLQRLAWKPPALLTWGRMDLLPARTPRDLPASAAPPLSWPAMVIPRQLA